MVEQPPDLRLDRLAVLRSGADPLRRALEHVHLVGRPGDGGEQLHAGGAVADHGDVAPGDVDVEAAPLGGVHDLAAEVLGAREVDEPRVGEGAHGADDGVGPHLEDRAVGPAHAQVPGAALVVPGGRHQLVLEVEVLPEPVLLGHVLDVALHLGLLGEVLRPRVVLLERVLVGEARRVDAGVGVLVDGPDATDLVAPLVDLVRDPELLHLHAGGDAAEPGADDGDEEALGELGLAVLPGRQPRVLLERRQAAAGRVLLVGHPHADRHVHEVAQLVVGRDRQRGGRALGQALEVADGLVDEPLVLLGGQRRRRAELGELGIARRLEQRHLDGGQVGQLDRLAEVALVDGGGRGHGGSRLRFRTPLAAAAGGTRRRHAGRAAQHGRERSGDAPRSVTRRQLRTGRSAARRHRPCRGAAAGGDGEDGGHGRRG